MQRGERNPAPSAILVVTYLESAAFRNLAPATRAAKRGRLDWIREAIGQARYAALQPRHVEALMEKKGGPEAANRLKKDMGQLFRFLLIHESSARLPKRSADRGVPARCAIVRRPSPCNSRLRGSCTVRTRTYGTASWKPRWLIRCVSAALLTFMDKQVPLCREALRLRGPEPRRAGRLTQGEVGGLSHLDRR